MVIRRSGFTLIELLIALAIMSMTLLISSLGFSFFMQKWQGNLGKFDQAASMATKLLLTRHAISGIAPYILRDKNNKPVIYFEGNQDSLVGVTTRSFYTPNYPSAFRLKIVQQPDFSYSLIYQEATFKNSPLVSLRQPLNFDHQVTLFSKLSDIKLSYYGFESLIAQSKDSEQQWWQSFNALSRGLLPTIVRIQFIMAGHQEQFDFSIVHVDPSRMTLFDEHF